MDAAFKLKVLGYLLRAAFDEWKASVRDRDLDGPYCCDGRECGCAAETVREMWSWHINPTKETPR